MKFRFFGKAVLAVLFITILGWVVSGLWNAVMPGLFDGVHPLDYWHALGLLLLCRILFGGFRGRGRGRGPGREGWRRWESMTPEEREKLQAGRMGRWGKRCRPQADSET
ncbi:hypothetical protein [Robbsia sp. KACC 23696]|uniref:hypothetical protein n=1 Tax=Robbsia sp. KACC 23696 TaxID=3149231 RepID=UPI00325A7680